MASITRLNPASPKMSAKPLLILTSRALALFGALVGMCTLFAYSALARPRPAHRRNASSVSQAQPPRKKAVRSRAHKAPTEADVSNADGTATPAPTSPRSSRTARARTPNAVPQPPEDDAENAANRPANAVLRRPDRIEFDARLIRGERAGTGSIVLFDRAPRELPTLSARRHDFVTPSVEAVLGPPRSTDR